MTPDPKARFVDTVRATIEAHDLLPRAAKGRGPAEPVIVGTSGGPDSVALLHVLHDLSQHEGAPPRQAFLRITPVVAHLHHGLRGEAADADQAFVEDLARRLGYECETSRADVRTEAESLGVGIEEAGRLARRRFLADVARRRGARKVALGHHADDRAETVLFHILRGTGVEGLASLGPRSPLDCGEEMPGEEVPGTPGDAKGPVPFPAAGGIEIVRPLINVGRGLILAYLSSISMSYRQDATNLAAAHTRNRIRNDLLPLLCREYNPKIDDALRRLSDQASAAGEVLADALDAVWRQVVREVPSMPGAGTPGAPPDAAASGSLAEVIIDADDFTPLRPWMQGAIIRRAVDRLGGGLKHMSAERTREAVAALLSKTVVGPIDLPGDLAAARDRRAIRIGRREQPEHPS